MNLYRIRQRGQPRRVGLRRVPFGLATAATAGVLSLGASSLKAVRPESGPTEPVKIAIVAHPPQARATASTSAWDEPRLIHPTTITISNAQRSLVLSRSRDYILRCPRGPVRLTGKISVWGGRNVVFERCNEQVTRPDWAGYFEDQARTLWIADVHFGGRYLTGGIQLQEPGATVVLRDVLFDTVRGSYTTNHAELVQTWAGPARLLVDGLTGSDTYQGLFLLPNQYYNGPSPKIFDLRHIDINNSEGGYALWLSDQHGPFRTNVVDVFVQVNHTKTWRGWWLWGFRGEESTDTGDGIWNNVLPGTPPGGHYVHATYNGATGVDQGISPPPLPSESG
jgi:hypothetical protein